MRGLLCRSLCVLKSMSVSEVGDCACKPPRICVIVGDGVRQSLCI